MSDVLVTGGMGFIGSHTVDRLVEEGYTVEVLDNMERQVHHGNKPSFLNRNARYISGDIRNKKSWEKALKGKEYIIHLAAAVGTGQSFWQARKYSMTNVSGTATLYELLTRNSSLKRDLTKIVVASSKSLYGEGSYVCSKHGKKNPEPRTIEQLTKKQWEMQCPECGLDMKAAGVREDKFPQNLNPYSLFKYATERLAMDYSSALGIETVAFRYFNVYGPRQSLSNPYTGVLAIFLSRMKNQRRPVIFEDGKQMRDFIFVEDVAKMNVSALERGHGVFNLGTGRPYSLLQIIELLNRELGMDVKPQIPGEFRPGDNRHDFADMTLFSKVYGKVNFTALEKGISALVEWSKTENARDMFETEERERRRFLSIKI